MGITSYPSRPGQSSSLNPLDPLTSSRIEPTGTLRLTAWVFGIGLVVQVALGWLLEEGDFGVFAIAIGLGSAVYALRDGGIGSYLIERGPYASPNVRANASWYSLGASVAAGLILALLAAVGGWIFDEGSIRSVLLIAAVSIPLGFFAPVARALLHSHNQARSAEILYGLAVALHYALLITFALLDLGAVSFVLPLLLINPFLSLVGWLVVRRTAIPFGRASTRGISRIARRSSQVLLVTAGRSLLRGGQFAALGLAASVELVGFYYFASRLVLGSVLSLAAPVRWFLVPTFASMHRDQWRRRRAALDSFLVGSLLIGTVPLMLVALAQPLEAFLWDGRWRQAVFAIQVLGVAAAFEVVVVVALMLHDTGGALRRRVELVAWRGLGLVGVMALAGWLTRSLDAIALLASLYLALSGIVTTIYVLESLGLEWLKIGRAVGSVYLLTGIGTGFALITGTAFDGAYSWLRLSASAAVFVLVVGTGARTLFESRLRRVAAVIERTTGSSLLQKTLPRSGRAQPNAPA